MGRRTNAQIAADNAKLATEVDELLGRGAFAVSHITRNDEIDLTHCGLFVSDVNSHWAEEQTEGTTCPKCFAAYELAN